MSTVRNPLCVGEVLSVTVRRKLTANRVLICLKGHALVAEPEHEVLPGDEIHVQVLSIFPRIRLRVMPNGRMPGPLSRSGYPRELRT